MTRRLDIATLMLVILGLALATRASAQAGPEPPAATPEPSAAAAATETRPPKLLAFVDLGYPDAAREQRLEPSVLLKLTIGEDGFVEDVSPVGPPAGFGFDELAIAAARRFVFEPAIIKGKPARAIVQYRYDFKLPVASAAAEQPKPEARLLVTIRSAESDRVLRDAELILTTPADPSFAERVTSDEAGVARFEGLTPGSYQLALSHPEYKSERHEEQLLEGVTTELTYRLERARDYEEYGAVARVKAPAREVTRRTIEREELTRVAGTRGDALRTIELLPGVSRPPFGAGLVLIRGSAPGDSQVLLDGIPVPLLYHFGGLTSFINSRALERIDFYPGNYSVRYGRALGGIVDVGVRDPSTDGYHGLLDVNLPLDSSLLLEGPVGDKASFLVGGRRSYVGEVLTAVLPEDGFSSFAAPVYYDYQAFVSYRPTDRDRIRIGLFGASDRLEVLFAEDESDPGVRGIELGQQFHRGQLAWKHQYSQKLEHDIQLGLGREDNVFKLPPSFDLSLEFNQLYLRAEWRYRVSETVQVIAGTDTGMAQYDVGYEGPPLDGEEGDNGSADFTARPQVAFTRRDFSYSAAAYLELALTPIKPLRIVPGLRLDYYELIQRFSFDPRISAIYSLNEHTRVKAGFGVFSQPPDPPEALPNFGNPRLLPNQALHYSVGGEHEFTEDLSLNLEGFYKQLYRRVVPTDAQQKANENQLSPPPFENDGIGRIYGLELQGRKLARGRWFGFLSYTLMRSERKDRDEPWRLFDYDQTHIFSAAATVRLGRGWEVGATLRVVSGNPNTPTVGAYHDQSTDTFVRAVGRNNSRRSPTFNRLDLRCEKTWKFDRWKLAWYLDVQNTYNAVNPEGVTYNFNYKEREQIRGLTILPILGLRGEI